MKVIIINPILYTSETTEVKKIQSIKDTMIYNLCLAFKKLGHEVTLIAAKDYEPLIDKKYDFNVEFFETKYTSVFKVNCFPLLKGLKKYLKNNYDNYDLIITGEAFLMSSLSACLVAPNKTIVWQELAKHNRILRKIPSKIWYNLIARLFQRNVRVVPRSMNAYQFISKYCHNVSQEYIDHGVNLNSFHKNIQKKDQFIVVSQLIERKRIDGIIRIFYEFLKAVDTNHVLYIIGTGVEEKSLKQLVNQLHISENVIFKGFMPHEEIIPILSESKALIVNTRKDNSMLSIVEALATCTPIVTTDVPYNVDYIIKNKLGVVREQLSYLDLKEIVDNNQFYIKQCEEYREKIDNVYKVKQFENQYKVIKGDKR